MSDPVIRSGPAQAFFSIGLAVLIGFIFYIGRGVLIPLVIAIFLCFLIFTLRQAVARIPGIGKYLPQTVCYLIAFTVIIMAFLFFIAIVSDNIQQLLRVWPDYEKRLSAFAGEVIRWFRSLDFLPAGFIGGFEEVQSAALNMVSPVLRQAVGSIGSITSNFMTVGTVLFYMAFILLERARIFKKIGLLSATDTPAVCRE